MTAASHQDYRRCTRGLLTAIVLIATTTVVKAERSTTSTTQPASVASDRRSLTRACQQFRVAAVKGPYGWGWPGTFELREFDEESNESFKKKTKKDREAPPPDIDLRVTAAVGVFLELAGRELGNKAAQGNAMEAARAIAAVQLSTGQIPALARLMPKPAGHAQSVGIVPDRQATCAALGLMLLVIESSGEQTDATVKSAATRAATWLARQQTSNGGWQSAYPPSAGPSSRRLIRLDSPGYRDATLTLLLAARVLGRQEYSLAADRSVEQLLKLRINTDNSPGKNLWGTAYTLGGDWVDDIPEFPRGIDMLAAHYSLQTLLCANLIGGKAALEKEISISIKAITGLPQIDGKYERLYHPFLREKDGDSKPAAGNFDQVAFARLMHTAIVAQTEGREVFGKKLWARLGPSERLAATVCKFVDDAIVDAPTKSESHLPEDLMESWTLMQRLSAAKVASSEKK